MERTEPFDSLVDDLRHDGLTVAADRLHALLHKTAWTTGSELYGELGLEMKGIRQAFGQRFSPRTKTSFKAAAAAVTKVWPDIGC
jgi:hypothetical protein